MMVAKNKGLTSLIRVLAVITFLGAVLIHLPVQAQAGNDAEVTTITGTVIDLDQDVAGNISEALIQTETEGEFLIVKDGIKGNELMQKIYKTVEVTGAVQESEDGRKEITVHSYRIIEAE